MRDYHVHTNFSDGVNSPEETVLSAIAMGMDTVGISDHSHTAFDLDYCMRAPYLKDNYAPYRAEIARLKEKYAGRITVLCGMEQDYYASRPAEGFDYVIGSVHYLKCGNTYRPVDEPPPMLDDTISEYFGGDVYALAEAYFELAADVVRKTRCDIIGHFDLMRKFNERHPLFDPQHPRYVAAWQRAVDCLLKENVPFEVNTGAIIKGYRTAPYPSFDIVRYITEHGGSVVLSSDAHRADKLCGEFGRLGEFYPGLSPRIAEIRPHGM